jgi:DNA-binding transcriptional ArsR family regulator
MGFEDDTYSSIFNALKHPIRRKILRILKEKPATYTEILNQLNIDNGLLNYHLDNMKDLLTKNEDEKYTLSEFGKATVSLVRGVEEPAREARSRLSLLGRSISWSKLLTVFIGVLVLTNIYTLSIFKSQQDWTSEQFTLNLSHADGDLRFTLQFLKGIIDEGKLNATSLVRLNHVVDEASLKFYVLSGLDQRHSDMWIRTSLSFELFEDLISDAQLALKDEPSSTQLGVVLSEDSLGRLRDVYGDIDALHKSLFPVSVHEYNLWDEERAEETNRVFAEVEQIRLSLAKAWTIIPEIQLLTAPGLEEQSRQLIIDAVGIDYYINYFSFNRTEYNSWDPSEWLTWVTYDYRVTVANYSEVVKVGFVFDRLGKLIRTEGFPDKDSLMPFNVTREQAISVGLKNVTNYVELTSGIGYEGSAYYWKLYFYHSPRESKSGSATEVLVDLHTGELISSRVIGWQSTS